MKPGEVVGPYRVTAKLGEGGMRAVYRARDTQLGRDVALKVLPDSVSHDPDRVARCTREAQPADIWILPMNPAAAPFRFFASPASDTLPVFSPNGR